MTPEFEKWAKSCGYKLSKRGDEYLYSPAAPCWEAWQARDAEVEALNARIAELEAARGAPVPVAWRVTSEDTGNITLTLQYPTWAEDDAELVIDGLYTTSQPQAASAPDGYVLVPVGLLTDLRDSANECYNDFLTSSYKDGRIRAIYEEQVRKVDELLAAAMRK